MPALKIASSVQNSGKIAVLTCLFELIVLDMWLKQLQKCYFWPEFDQNCGESGENR